ncbi:MAG: serine hydrolase [Flavobacteriaceae bacterium]|nr:serine hydrolase [Flavobacteriaceae bacterium]
MKKLYKYLLIGIAGLVLIWIFVLPFHLKKSLIYWYPNLDDYTIFENDSIQTAQPQSWKLAENYNLQKLSKENLDYLKKYKTTAFLVIQDNEIIYEKYWKECSDSTLSNLFSATKSIVSLLIGIAIDEGKISSLEDKIGNYIPEFANDERGNISIRNLLTMSSGLDWDEQYTSPLSVTTQAYYGNNLRELVTNQKIATQAGKSFKYLSADTQLLAYIVEKATGKSVSEYAQEKIWKPIGAEHQALWSKDAKNGDIRAFCCFHTNAKDIARIGQLILNKGKWNDQQIVSEKYIKDATTPAKDLVDENGKTVDFYGYQWWILHLNNMEIPYMRGHLGQYIFSIPEKNAVIVRLGEEVDEEVGQITTDIPEYVRMALPLLN